jgi:hypothetical protein
MSIVPEDDDELKGGEDDELTESESEEEVTD